MKGCAFFRVSGDDCAFAGLQGFGGFLVGVEAKTGFLVVGTMAVDAVGRQERADLVVEKIVSSAWDVAAPSSRASTAGM